MSETEQVALWVSLISGIAGIVVSIVAIVFAVLVNNRAAQVSDQTIKSLQKIESTVERLSKDTNELIKAAWDKLLGSFQAPTTGDKAAKEIASGLAAELRAELGLIKGEASGDKVGVKSSASAKDLEEALENLEKGLAVQLERPPSAGRPGAALDGLRETIESLSEPARALLYAIMNKHLELSEYRALRKSKFLSSSLQDLRASGLIIPLVHQSEDGSHVPCYYYPPGFTALIRAVKPLISIPSTEVREQVLAELRNSGYVPPESDH